MMETREIQDAMRRLSRIARTVYQFDSAGLIFGDGPMHYLVELGDSLFMAWENNETGTMIVNPITRFELEELEEMGAPWTVLRVTAELTEGIQFRTVDDIELSAAYHRMKGQMFAASTLPVMPVH
jgi:hypothetical protein